MYEQGYHDGFSGKSIDVCFASDSNYYAGYDCGRLDRKDWRRETGEVNQAAQDYVDGWQRAEAGDEFELALLESESYRAGFRDGEQMNGVAS